MGQPAPARGTARCQNSRATLAQSVYAYVWQMPVSVFRPRPTPHERRNRGNRYHQSANAGPGVVRSLR
eukprot:8347034-Lingulodinium_polyedra.AAC.1